MKYEFSGTPGPWRWEVNEQSKSVQLCGGKIRYDLYVIDFERWGMHSAQPRFRDTGQDELQIMHAVSKWASVVPCREHHKGWFKTIDHPDANLISAAPDLLESLVRAVEHIDATNNGYDDHDPRRIIPIWYEPARSAIHKALNIKP